MGHPVAAVGRQLAGLLALMFAALSGFQLGKHVSVWMYVREHGGVVPLDAVMLALPFAMAAFAASIASRSRSVPAISAMVLMVFATVGMLTQRFTSQKPAAQVEDAGR